MRPHYSITTQPITEPITYDQAAEHLRVDSEADMAHIDGLISVAREYVESVTGRATMATSYKLVAPSWLDLIGRYCSDVIPIYRTPLVTMESVKYYAPDASTLTTMSAGDYRVITTTEPGILQIIADLPAVDDRPDAIQIEFTAGYSVASAVPATLRHAIKMMVAHLYENRVPVAFAGTYEIPYTLKTLLENNKIGGWCA
jgi:uncharacterized phiE125 gp8 family phage protein